VKQGEREESDPLAKARRLAGPARPKRFYESVEMPEEPGEGYVLRLDGKRAVTPGKKTLAVPRGDLARAIAAEWAAQGEVIDPIAMPVTRLANSAIDGVPPRLEEARQPIREYAAADLLYYRAGEPEGLVAAQQEVWDPVISWAERYFGVRFVLSEGVMHVAQPETTLAALKRAIDRFDEPFRLAGLSLATTLTGSALVALALAEGALDQEAAWKAAHVDEDWNIARWGADAEAMLRRARRHADFRAAALALRQSR